MLRSLTVAAAIAIAAPAAFAVTSVEKIRNDKVVVTEDTLAPGESEELSQKSPTMLVYMANGKAQIGSAAGRRDAPVKEGQVVFEKPGAGILKNTGSASLHLARIEFLGPGSKEAWGKTGLAPSYVVLEENQLARAYDIRIPPHALEPQHTHHARVVVALSGAHLEHILPNGTKQPSDLKTGEIVWRPGATHTGHNMGDTPLWCIAVEPK